MCRGHHVDDGANAAALVADADAPVELDLGGGVGAVAELVLEPLQRKGIAGVVVEHTGDQEAGRPPRSGPARGRHGSSGQRGTTCARSGGRCRRRRRGPSRTAVARVELARTSEPPCFSVMPMPAMAPRLPATGRRTEVVLPGGQLRRLPSRRGLGFARRQAPAAYVMDTGHRCPASTWDHTMNPAARRTWARVRAGSVHGLAVSPLATAASVGAWCQEGWNSTSSIRSPVGAWVRSTGGWDAGPLARLLGLGRPASSPRTAMSSYAAGLDHPSQALLEGGVGGGNYGRPAEGPGW